MKRKLLFFAGLALTIASLSLGELMDWLRFGYGAALLSGLLMIPFALTVVWRCFLARLREVSLAIRGQIDDEHSKP